MSEKDRLSFHEGDEEEFHITDDDIDRELAAMEDDHSASASSDAFSETSAEKSSIKQRFSAFKQLKRKHWIIIAVIVIILLFGLLKTMGSGQQSQASFDQITPAPIIAKNAEVITKKPETEMAKTVFEPSVSASSMPSTATTPSTANSLLPASPLSAPSATASHEQLKTDLTAIAGNETKLTQALEAIQQQNQTLTQQLTTLSSRVGDLESTVTESRQAVAGLSQQTAMPKKEDVPAAPLPRLTQSVPAGPKYTVEAVVPQRAWLQAGDGSTITVMIGDDVPGLGAIVAIDPYSGNVTTASGTVIKYGS